MSILENIEPKEKLVMMGFKLSRKKRDTFKKILDEKGILYTKVFLQTIDNIIEEYNKEQQKDK